MSQESTTASTSSVGLIGLGQMGGPIGRHLAAAGHHVVGFDIDEARRASAAETGVEVVTSCREVADRAGIVITSLPSSGALLAVLSEPEVGLLASSAAAELVVVELSTLDLETKHEAAALVTDAGGTMLDCPVSGTFVQAENGDLSVYASGDPDAIARCADVFMAFSRSYYDVGPFGSGSVMKYAANLLVGIHNAAAAEALVLAAKGGVDPTRALEVLSDGAGSSRMLEVRGPDIISGGYRPGSHTGLTFEKDMRIIGQFAASRRCPTPMFATATQLHTASFAAGHIDDDTSAVSATLRAMAGLDAGELRAADKG